MPVWQLVARDKQAHPASPRATRPLNPDDRPQQAPTPPQVWGADLRYLGTSDGRWLDSVLSFDGDRRALVGAGWVERQKVAPLVQVCRQAMARWGAPAAVGSDHGAVVVARQPCRAPLAIQWAPSPEGHPWQNLAEGGCAVHRRRRAASGTGCPARETVSRQHPQCVQDDQGWGHWAHQRQDAPGRRSDVSPEVILANARGRESEPARLRRVFRLRQLTRQGRQPGQIRRPHVGRSVDRVLWGPPVAVRISDAAWRIEPAEHLLVSSPWLDETTRRRSTAVAEQGRPPDPSFPMLQLRRWALELVPTVGRMPPDRRAPRARQGVRTRHRTLVDGFAH